MVLDRRFMPHLHGFFMPYLYRLLRPRRRLLTVNGLLGVSFLGTQGFLDTLSLAPLLLSDRFVVGLLMAHLLALVAHLLACRGARTAAVSGLLLVAARTVAAMAPPAAAVLVAFARAAFALRWPLLLLFGPGLVLPRLLFRPRLLGFRLLLRPRLLVPLLVGPAIPALGALAAFRPLAAGLTVASLLQAALLLAVAVLVARRATVAPAVAPISS